MKTWGVGERARFVTDFAKQLLRTNSEPVMVILEEADAFIPQRPAKGEEAMLGEMDRMVRWGRSSGIGCTLITQRSAKVNKDVTTQAETLIAFRTTGPQDRDAIDNWIKFHAGEAKRDELLSTLPELATGTAWVWSPEWLDVFDRYAFRRRTTYDSASTPKVGEKRPKPKELAPVDLEKLRGQMAATIERAKAEDPRELRRQIAALKRELEDPRNSPAPSRPQPKVIEKPVLKEAQLKRLEADLVRFDKAAERLTTAWGVIRELADRLAANGKLIAAAIDQTRQPLAGRREERTSRAVSLGVTPAPPSRGMGSRGRQSIASGNGDAALGRAERAILAAAVQRLPKSSSRAQLAVLSGYSIKSSSFANALGALRSQGLIAGAGDDNRATDAGAAALGAFDPLPTGDELVRYWQGQLGKAEAALLEVFVRHYPHDVDKDTLSKESGYSASSSSFANALGKLRTLELVTGLRASEELFV